MSSKYFARIRDAVDLARLRQQFVVVVGVGTVGSQIAAELAKSGVGHLRVIDHDRLETENLARHVLPVEYIGWNKAEALAVYLADQVPCVQTEAAARKVDTSLPDSLLDQWLADVDLIIAATDDQQVQRQVGRRALALGVPAIFPALYGEGGGEVVVQLDPRFPCYYCWSGFRAAENRLRSVTALNVSTLPIVHIATKLSLGILDPHSEHTRLMAAQPGEPPNQLFVLNSHGALSTAPLTRRPRCPSCSVGPAPNIAMRAPPKRVEGTPADHNLTVTVMPKSPPLSRKEIKHQHLILGLLEREHEVADRQALRSDRRRAHYWLLVLQTIAVLGAVATAILAATSGTLGKSGGITTGALCALAFGLEIKRREVWRKLASVLSEVARRERPPGCL